MNFKIILLFERKQTAYSMCVCVCMLSHSVMSDSVIPWTVDCQTPIFMGFPREEY